MADAYRRRTPRELALLRGLDAHTRAHALLLVGEHPLLVVTSGRRTPLGNRRVGGVANSWHLQGRAVDFGGPVWDLSRAAATAWEHRISERCTGPEEVLLEDLGKPNQHLHVAW